MDVNSSNRRSYTVCLPHTPSSCSIPKMNFFPLGKDNHTNPIPQLFCSKRNTTNNNKLGLLPFAVNNSQTISCMFLNLMFNLLHNHNQQQSQSPQLSPCMTAFPSSPAFPPSLIASSTLSKGAVEFRPLESRATDNPPYPTSGKNSGSSAIRSLVRMQEYSQTSYTTYVHLCFPSTRSSGSPSPRNRDSSFFSSFQTHIHSRLGPSINLHTTPYNLQFSSPRSFNSQSPIGTNHLIKKKKKKSNLNQVLYGLRKNNSRSQELRQTEYKKVQEEKFKRVNEVQETGRECEAKGSCATKDKCETEP